MWREKLAWAVGAVYVFLHCGTATRKSPSLLRIAFTAVSGGRWREPIALRPLAEHLVCLVDPCRAPRRLLP